MMDVMWVVLGIALLWVAGETARIGGRVAFGKSAPAVAAIVISVICIGFTVGLGGTVLLVHGVRNLLLLLQ